MCNGLYTLLTDVYLIRRRHRVHYILLCYHHTVTAQLYQVHGTSVIIDQLIVVNDHSFKLIQLKYLIISR